jgi:autotransporter-associated beta strand protein
LSGTFRIQTSAVRRVCRLVADFGEVQTGAQLYTAAQTYNNDITITGNGFADANGLIGALRLEPGANWAGSVNVNGSAKIGAHNGTATVSGNISGGELTVNATNYNMSYTLIFAGTNTYGGTTIGGQNTQTAGVPSMRLNIGSGGTTGTLGTGNVTINGDGANGVLGFDRADGYTLLPGQSITGAGSQITRTFIDIDTLGAGFSDNGNSITLGTAGIGTGGNIRIAQARANAIANITGTLTAERIVVSSAQTGGVLNIGTGSTVSANYLSVGEVANGSGTVNQAAGSTVTVVGQLRAGHFGTNTSTYNMNGGTLTLTGASPNNSPSSAGAGDTTTAGDNNLNITNPTTIVGGGIYLGIDGTGIFNHNNGTVTTNWIVLDNRGDTGSGANMPDGIDRYNLNGGTLNIRSSYGLIQRNASAAVSFAGGTVRVDNTGTGMNTGANLNIPLDANITVSGTASTLDTNGALNQFTLNRNVAGSGTLNLTGGGTVNLSSIGFQQFAPNLASSGAVTSLVKLGTGTTTMTGNASAFTGPVSVTAGRLNLPAIIGTSGITVADGAALGGEPIVAALTFGATTGSTLFIDASTPGALTAGTLTINGTPTVDFAAPPTAPGPITVINYAAVVGVPATPVLANAASYRPHSFDLATPGTVKLNLTTKDLTWTGAANANWDVNTSANWNDGVGADNFFAGDRVTFGDGAAPVAVAVSSGVSPFKTIVNSNTNNYTFNSTGNGIAGPGSLEKLGTSTLTLTGANNYTGQTVIGGGTLAYAGGNEPGQWCLYQYHRIEQRRPPSLHGQYRARSRCEPRHRCRCYRWRGRTLGHHERRDHHSRKYQRQWRAEVQHHRHERNGQYLPRTIFLSGDNSAYTGAITVEGTANILSTLTIASQLAVPNASSITLMHPSASVTNGNATTLALNGVSLPAGTSLNLNGFVNGGVSQRSQITSTGNSTVNGPLSLTGNGRCDCSILTKQWHADSQRERLRVIARLLLGHLLLRGAGNGVVNGTVNLPTGTVNKTDGWDLDDQFDRQYVGLLSGFGRHPATRRHECSGDECLAHDGAKRCQHGGFGPEWI